VAGLKTHAKALLIVSRENGRIRRRVHLSTGNYNDQTSRLYSDVGLMTSDPAVCSDVAEFFNLLTGRSDLGSFRTLCIAPSDMKRRIVELLEREAMVSSPDRPGLVMAKLNSLQDPDIISAVYRASGAGVRIRLNVRGICCLRPGIPGVSENVEVVSVVDRYLEHARILVLANGGAEEVYLSSADWMTRNLERRMELLFPVRQASHRRRLRDFVGAFFRDGARGWELGPDGTWSRLSAGAEMPAQEYLYREASSPAQVD
jgi:polyphosphate kinase